MDWNIPTLEELEHSVWRCTACGTCKTAYDYGPPATNADICPAGTEFGFEGYMASKGKIAFARGILTGELELDQDLVDAIYKCTLCGGCQNQCQLDHKPVIIEMIEAMRRRAVEQGVGPLPSHKIIAQSIATYSNPYQGPRRVRTDWTRAFRKGSKPIKDIQKEAAPILYFVGCTGAYNQAGRVMPTATASVFNKLGIDFGILGEDELCCGSTAMRLGEVDTFKRLAEANLETFQRLHRDQGVETIVTSCAGCFRALHKDYALAVGYEEAMEGIEVVHVVDYFHRLLQEGDLDLQAVEPRVVTYHDPCHTGRHMAAFSVDEDGSTQYPGAYLGQDDAECVYDAPRALLEAIPGVELREMVRIRANSYCCGGGGGVMTGFGEWATKNAAKRIAEGEETGAQEMVTICPFCRNNLGEGAKRVGHGTPVRDLTELIDEALAGESGLGKVSKGGRTMKPKERVLERLAGRAVDKTPVGCTTTYGMVDLMEACGAARPLADTDPVAMATLALAGVEHAGFEWVKAMGWDIVPMSEAFGCALGEPRIDMQYSIKGHPLAEGLDALDYPADFLTRGRFPMFEEQFRILKDRVGEEYAVYGETEGPFTCAANLVGTEQFMRWTAKEPEKVQQVLEVTKNAMIDVIKWAFAQGADYFVMAEPSSGPALMSPRSWERFVKPVITEVAAAVDGPLVLHICANTDKIVPLMCDTGVAGISIEEKADMKYAVEVAERAGVAVFGNVATATTMFMGTPEEVYDESIAALEAGTHFLTPGCGIAPRSPLENVRQLRKARDDFFSR